MVACMVCAIVIPPCVVYGLKKNEDTATNDNASNPDHYANASAVSITLPTTSNYINMFAKNVDLPVLLSALPSGTKINGDTINTNNYELFNYDEAKWGFLLSDVTPTYTNGEIKISGIVASNGKALPAITIVSFLTQNTSSDYYSLSYSKKIYTDNSLGQNPTINASSLYSYQYTILDIIELLGESSNQLYGYNETQWASILQDAQIQYQEGDIVLANLMYNNASLQSVEITGFTSNNDLDMETMLDDFGATKLSNNLDNIYPLQDPLVGYTLSKNLDQTMQ